MLLDKTDIFSVVLITLYDDDDIKKHIDARMCFVAVIYLYLYLVDVVVVHYPLYRTLLGCIVTYYYANNKTSKHKGGIPTFSSW